MNSKIKSVLQYLITIAITGVLVWLSLRGINAGEGHDTADLIWSVWTKSNKVYLLLMGGILMLSHVLRAERWRMLLEPSGNKGTLWNSFLSVMVGYLVNLAIPRGGEVSRCYNLFKLEKTPVEVSFGTVVVERLVDVICMLILVTISFVSEWGKLKGIHGCTRLFWRWNEADGFTIHDRYSTWRDRCCCVDLLPPQ
ncbi:MAG: lysylphosphatidylglycerol synthase transmembrane domain-containing protein [Bacteroidota bacterium]